MTWLSDSVASIRYAKAPTFGESDAGEVALLLLGTASEEAGGERWIQAMGLPILAADLSQMPKYGVIARSPLAQIFPSQGRRRRTSSDVRLVLHLNNHQYLCSYLAGLHLPCCNGTESAGLN